MYLPDEHCLILTFVLIDLTGTGDSAMSRRKSFKKSLRESFRKLRKGRSQRKAKKDDKPKEEAKPAEEKKEG